MSSVAPTLFFLLFKAAANASAKDAGGPPDELPLPAAAGGCGVGSPRTSCSKTEGLSSCDLSTFFKAPMPPAPLIEANKASRPISPVASVNEPPPDVPAADIWGGGGGGGAPPD